MLRLRLNAVLRLARIEHGVILGLVPVASYLLTNYDVNTIVIVLLYLSALLAEIYLFVENDILNLEEDKINRPHAPLVRGLISVRTAWVIAIASITAGMIPAAYCMFIDPKLMFSFCIYVVAITLGTLYNVVLKRTFLLGNLATALTTSLAFLYGANIDSSNIMLPLLLFLTSTVASLGREFVKTAIDVEGDRAAGYRTIAIVLGADKTLVIARKVELAAITLLGLTAVYSALALGIASLPIVAGSTATIAILYAKLGERPEKLRLIILKLMAIVILCYFLSAILYRLT